MLSWQGLQYMGNVKNHYREIALLSVLEKVRIVLWRVNDPHLMHGRRESLQESPQQTGFLPLTHSSRTCASSINHFELLM